MENENYEIDQLVEFNFFGRTKASGKFQGWFDEDKTIMLVEVVSDDAGIEKIGDIARWNITHLSKQLSE